MQSKLRPMACAFDPHPHALPLVPPPPHQRARAAWPPAVEQCISGTGSRTAPFTDEKEFCCSFRAFVAKRNTQWVLEPRGEGGPSGGVLRGEGATKARLHAGP
jgi:hypothetical protein